KFDLMMVECDAVKTEIDKLEREAREQIFRETDRDLRDTRRPPEGQTGDPAEEALNAQTDRRYRRAFVSYLRNGLSEDGRGSHGLGAEDRAIMDRHNAEKRDLGITTG